MSVISDKFFADKAVGALWDVAVSIKRGNPLPLDKDAVVHGIDELNAVAAGAVSYPGQIIAVVIDAVKDGEEVVSPERVDLYYLDHNKTPRLVAPEVEIPEVPEYVGDNKSITVTNHAISLLGFASAADGKLPMKENGAIVWKTLEDIGAGDGNDNTTYEFEALTDKAGFKVQPIFNGQPANPEDAVEIVLANIYTKTEVDNLLGGKVDSATLNNYYLKTEVDNLLKDYAKTAEVNKTLEDYAKSADVYTKTEVDDAVGGVDAKFGDYYKKTETMSSQEINTAISTAIGNADHLKREIVEALPLVSSADANTIYMIKVSSLVTGDNYEEWMLVGEEFVKIGDSTVDLTGYYTKDEVDGIFEDYMTSEAIAAAIKVETDRATGAEEALGKRIDDVEGDIEGINGEITTINGTIDTLATKTDLEGLQKTVGEINTALEGKASTQSVTDLAALIGETKVETQISDALKDYYAKTEVDNKIGTPGTPAEKDEEGNVVVNPVAGTGIFVNTYSKAEINSLLDEIEGGSTESAASVARQLEEYKGTNNKRVQDIEDILNDTENAEGGTTKGLASRVGDNEKAIADILTTKLPAKADLATVNALIDELGELKPIISNSVQDVKVDGVSVVNEGKVAEIDLTPYLKSKDAATTYATIASVTESLKSYSTTTAIAETYLAKADAEATYAKSADVANTYLTKEVATQTYATKAEITEANYVSYSDTVIMNGGAASLN